MSSSYSLLIHSCEGISWIRRKAPNLRVIICQDGQAVDRTTVIKRDLEPKWDYLCNLSSDSPVAMQLWHKALLPCRDLCLGVVHAKVAALLDLSTADTQFIKLLLIGEHGKSKGKPTGLLRLRLVHNGEAPIMTRMDSSDDVQKLRLRASVSPTGEKSETMMFSGDTDNWKTLSLEAGLSALIAKLEVIVRMEDKLAKIRPYATMAWKVLVSVSKTTKTQQEADDQLCKLANTMVSVFSFVDKANILVMQFNILEEKILPIVKQTVECALFIQEYTMNGFSDRFIHTTSKDMSKAIDDLCDTLLRLKDTLQSTLNIQGVSLFTDVHLQNGLDLDALKVLNPREMNAAARPTCLPGTRLQLLDEIVEWLLIPNGTDSILWLSGVAGSGKSTIATTISVYFRGLNRLGGFVFFDRNDPSNSHPDDVIRTLIYFLAHCNSHIGSAIASVLRCNPETVDAPLQTQFQKLLLEPLLAVEHLIQGPIIVILDALDECGDPESRRQLLSIISTEFHKLPWLFRFLITSRRETDLTDSFSHCFPEKAIGTSTSAQDVRLFLFHEMGCIQKAHNLGPKWPKPTQMQAMINLAGGLFIWAATAVRYINKIDDYSPNDKLEALITSNSTTLDNLYASTLRHSAPWDDPAFAMHARAVLGCIVYGKVPLTETTIDMLLGSEHSCEVLKRLGSVVHWQPGCVARILHASFADYLTDDNRSKGEPWGIDTKLANQTLGLGCLKILNSHLRFNICGLEDSHLFNADVPDIHSRVGTNISAALSYSSVYWAIHIANTPFDERILDQIDSFFRLHLLFWLEVLSLLNRVPIAVAALSAAMHYVKGHNNDLQDFIIDAAKFVSAFAPVIAQSAPHIYLSAVPFAPLNSRTARQFKLCFPCTLTFQSMQGIKWPSIQKVLRGHTNAVCSVNFSPDGTRLASGSADSTVRIWDTQTGQLVGGPCQGHKGSVWCVHFSPDGKWITSGSFDKTVCVWDAQTGVLASGPFIGHTHPVQSVHFSPDGMRVVSGSLDRTMRVWDTRTGALVVGPFEGHKDYINSVQFSPDGTRIASGSDDMKVGVWDAQSGTLVAGLFQGHTDNINSVNFSPDGTQIVSGSDDKTIRVWDAQTGVQVAGPFIGHTSTVQSVHFSPDGTQITSASGDKTVRVWDTLTGGLATSPFIGHNGLVNSVHFSPDGTQIASGSDDRTVRVWDAQAGMPTHTFDNDVKAACSTADSRHLRAASPHSTLQKNGEVGSKEMDNSYKELLIFDSDSGWTRNNAGGQMFWVPPWLRDGLYLRHNTLVLSERATTKLDLSQLVHGTEWTQCVDVNFTTNRIK